MSERLQTLTRESAADLRLFQWKAVRGTTVAKCNVASNAVASSVLGILQNKPNTGQHASIAYGGMSTVVAGGAITELDIITFNGSGRIATVASGQMAIGRAIEAAGADGDEITALLFPPVRWAGAV